MSSETPRQDDHESGRQMGEPHQVSTLAIKGAERSNVEQDLREEQERLQRWNISWNRRSARRPRNCDSLRGGCGRW
jgi:hypothetical protein